MKLSRKTEKATCPVCGNLIETAKKAFVNCEFCRTTSEVIRKIGSISLKRVPPEKVEEKIYEILGIKKSKKALHP